MYKVMIIDDEPIIVKGLCNSVSWEKYGCEVIATAGNGIEGRRLIMEKRPDMIFLDICMPEMDGLTMVAALKSEYRDLQITVLTGFRDFEYAKTALNLGVSRFLLKPSNMDEIEEAIRYMIKQTDLRKPGEEGGRETLSLEAAQNAENAEREEPFKDHEDPAGNFIVRNAIAYMEEHYREKLLLSEVAEKVYVSQWHLSKLLNKENGQNFSELLNGIRIKKAEELLKDPSLRIGDIAEEVGFLEVTHFSRVFKKITGMSPNEYRNSN